MLEGTCSLYVLPEFLSSFKEALVQRQQFWLLVIGWWCLSWSLLCWSFSASPIVSVLDPGPHCWLGWLPSGFHAPSSLPGWRCSPSLLPLAWQVGLGCVLWEVAAPSVSLWTVRAAVQTCSLEPLVLLLLVRNRLSRGNTYPGSAWLRLCTSAPIYKCYSCVKCFWVLEISCVLYSEEKQTFFVHPSKWHPNVFLSILCAAVGYIK